MTNEKIHRLISHHLKDRKNKSCCWNLLNKMSNRALFQVVEEGDEDFDIPHESFAFHDVGEKGTTKIKEDKDAFSESVAPQPNSKRTIVVTEKAVQNKEAVDVNARPKITATKIKPVDAAATKVNKPKRETKVVSKYTDVSEAKTKKAPVTDPNDGVYSGEILNNQKHGRGTMKYANGNVYVGDWVYDKKHGKGKMSYSNENSYQPPKNSTGGDVYEGDWEDDEATGQGKYISINGDVFEGAFQNDNYHGRGKAVYHNGSTYYGNFFDNSYHKYGVLTYENGDVYRGEWQHGKRHGQGTLVNKDGDIIFEGEWRNNFSSNAKPKEAASPSPTKSVKRPPHIETSPAAKKAASGATSAASTIKSSGTKSAAKSPAPSSKGVKRKRPSSIGPETSKLHGDGEYKGERKDGKRHGRGTIHYLSGNSYSGTWRDGKLHGTGTYKFACGDVYTGEFSNDQITGRGVYTDFAGDVYEGYMLNGLSHGHGTYTAKNGTVYEGDYQFDLRHGQGTMRYAISGDVYEGAWENDERHGQGVLTKGGKVNHDGWWSKGWWSDKQVIVRQKEQVKDYNPVFSNQGVPVTEADSSESEEDQEDEEEVQQTAPHKRSTPAVRVAKSTTVARKSGATMPARVSASASNRNAASNSDKGEESLGEEEPSLYGRRSQLGTLIATRKTAPTAEEIMAANRGNINRLVIPRLPTPPEIKTEVFTTAVETKVYPNGDKYVGQIMYNQRHGQGEMKYANGNVYTGSWKFDQKVGKGRMVLTQANSCDPTYPGSDTYEGEFRDDQITGYGVYTHSYGDVFEGEMLNGLCHGRGRFTAKNGTVYNGQMANDFRNGEGVMQYTDGHIYSGHWVNQKRHGRGVLWKGNRVVHDGQWVNDKPSIKKTTAASTLVV